MLLTNVYRTVSGGDNMKHAKQGPHFTREPDFPDKPHYILDEDEPQCAEYVLMREQGNLPALQEYMREMHAHIAYR
jgi:hypothetical protein